MLGAGTLGSANLASTCAATALLRTPHNLKQIKQLPSCNSSRPWACKAKHNKRSPSPATHAASVLRRQLADSGSKPHNKASVQQTHTCTSCHMALLLLRLNPAHAQLINGHQPGVPVPQEPGNSKNTARTSSNRYKHNYATHAHTSTGWWKMAQHTNQ